MGTYFPGTGAIAAVAEGSPGEFAAIRYIPALNTPYGLHPVQVVGIAMVRDFPDEDNPMASAWATRCLRPNPRTH